MCTMLLLHITAQLLRPRKYCLCLTYLMPFIAFVTLTRSKVSTTGVLLSLPLFPRSALYSYFFLLTFINTHPW